MKNEKFVRYKKRSRWLLLGGIILVLVSPALLTHPSLYTWLSLFDKSANIVSAIGGITSPLVSLIGAILVYLSFEQQIEANHIQKKALKKEIIQDRIKNQYDTLDKHLSEIKDEFYQLRYKRHL